MLIEKENVMIYVSHSYACTQNSVCKRQMNNRSVVQVAKNIEKEFSEEIFEKRLEIGQILSRLLEGVFSLDDL